MLCHFLSLVPSYRCPRLVPEPPLDSRASLPPTRRILRDPPRRTLVYAGCALLLAACSASVAERSVDERTLPLLEESHAEVLGDREQTVLYPEAAAEPAEEQAPGEDTGQQAPERIVLSLEEALRTAFRSNRQFLSQQESLYLTGVSLLGARYDFSPQVSADLAYRFAGGDQANETHNLDARAGVSQSLPFGGTWSVDGATNWFDADTPRPPSPFSFTSSLGATFTMPLLRGAGTAIARESLTQAERNLVYATRDFELFREDFSIDVANRYFGLVRQQQSIENVRRNLDGFIFARRQAEALFDVGRINELDVLRARRSELQSEDDLIEAEEDLQLALDQFKIFLGLSPEVEIEIVSEIPEFAPVPFDLGSAIEVARVNRLDFLNRREQLEDASRSLRIAENFLLPDLSVSASYGLNAGPDPGFSNQGFDQGAYSLSVNLEIPFDRFLERNSLRSSQIAYDREVRALEEFEDNLVIEIKSAFREIERRGKSLDIQLELIVDQEKNRAIAQLRFERGEVSNRDVVESEQALLDARNSLINEQVNYEIARLRLLRDLGILFLDEEGIWKPR